MLGIISSRADIFRFGSTAGAMSLRMEALRAAISALKVEVEALAVREGGGEGDGELEGDSGSLSGS